MINRTFENIKTNKATGFVPYIVAHYPNRDTFKEALTLLAELNADVIEIGIPFTDPIAEGKVIEKAHHKVLEDNFNISDLLDDVKDFKSKFDIPLIAMGYTNSFINPDQESFCQIAKNAGFDGFLIVDMPYVEHEMIKIIKNNDLEFVQLLAPTSTDQTITNCLANEPAMVYYITQRGVTGSGNLDYAEITENLKAIRNKINVPLVTGFGIKTTEHVKQFKNFTDGIVIGSSIVDILSKPNPITTLENYISPIIQEIKV